MILEVSDGHKVSFGAPRTCGDDPDSERIKANAALCSPHMRG